MMLFKHLESTLLRSDRNQIEASMDRFETKRILLLVESRRPLQYPFSSFFHFYAAQQNGILFYFSELRSLSDQSFLKTCVIVL